MASQTSQWKELLDRLAELPRENGSPELAPESLEACLLENERRGRKFRRLSADDVRELLGV